ncbi:MAG TPA: bifunctional alpha/beta hydrolase/OsmC family protein [Geminicoccaceae bacterium]|nr:bifunctional alpha/beta hydrolase/OsmC family protein [Geminicoccaceae bacterium]
MVGRSERITFANARGEQLAARLDMPADAPRALALFAHCFTCSKDVFAAARISQGLAERGLAVLRFDFTGLGASEGDFANTNFSSNLEDLVAAADFLRAEYQAPRILLGHSLGGAAVLAAAHRVPEAVAVATIAAPADPAHVGQLLASARAEIEAQGEAEVTIAGRSFRVQKQFLDDIAGHRLKDHIAQLRRALIIFHAPRDEIVGIENAGQIFAAAKHPKSFVSLDDADHLLTRRPDAVYVADVLAAWVGRYLPEVDAVAAAPEVEEREVVVAETGQGRFAQFVRVGRHELRADEPASVQGGLDTGPGPYDFLLAGLGACTSMTLRLYAEHKGLPLDLVTVRLRHDKIHAEDCADCETREGRLDQIERTLELAGVLDAAARQRLLEIADKCPVHRTLTGEIKIRTKLA